MAKKSAKTKPAQPESKEEPESLGGGQEGHGKITKSEAVRRALADGVDQPADGVAYVRDNFGLELSPTHFSAVKSTHLKKQQGESAPKGKPGRKPKAAVEGYLAPPPKPAADGETDLLAAMEAMKPLVASLGADKVKRIVDLLG
jgi:hypothetical protein